MSVAEYAGKVVAIDGYAWLHRGVHACAAELGRGEKSDKHVEFCLGRVSMLLHYKVRSPGGFGGSCFLVRERVGAELRGVWP